MASADDDDQVPRLPRGRGLSLDKGTMFRIAATLALLIAILVMRRPCADATGKFVTNFGEGSGSGAVMKPGTIDVPAGSGSATGSGSAAPLEYVSGSASDEEVRAAWERAKANAREDQRSGSGAASGSASGSGSGSGTASGPGSGSNSGSGTR